MAIIKPKDELTSLKIKIPTQLFNQIQAYCKWAKIGDDLSHFFTQASEFVLEKDKDWKQYFGSKSEVIE